MVLLIPVGQRDSSAPPTPEVSTQALGFKSQAPQEAVLSLPLSPTRVPLALLSTGSHTAQGSLFETILHVALLTGDGVTSNLAELPPAVEKDGFSR